MSDFLYNYTNASGAPITIKIYKRGIWWHIQQISPTIRAYGEDFVSKGEAMEYLNLNAVNGNLFGKNKNTKFGGSGLYDTEFTYNTLKDDGYLKTVTIYYSNGRWRLKGYSNYQLRYYNSTFNSKEEAIEYLNTHAKNNTMEFGKSKNTKFGGDVEMTGENSAGSSSDMDDLFHRMKEMGINDPEPQNWNALFKIVDEYIGPFLLLVKNKHPNEYKKYLITNIYIINGNIKKLVLGTPVYFKLYCFSELSNPPKVELIAVNSINDKEIRVSLIRLNNPDVNKELNKLFNSMYDFLTISMSDIGSQVLTEYKILNNVDHIKLKDNDGNDMKFGKSKRTFGSKLRAVNSDIKFLKCVQ